MNADEKITTSAMLVIVLEGEYEYTFKGSKLIQGSSHDKILFGSIVQTNLLTQIKFKTPSKIAWTTTK